MRVKQAGIGCHRGRLSLSGGRKPSFCLQFLCLGFLACLVAPAPGQAQEAVAIEEAEVSGLVSVHIEGISHYFDRPVVNMYVTNQSGQRLKIRVSQGMTLKADDPELSDLVVVRESVQTLQKDEVDRLFELHIYSTDARRNFSSPVAQYSISGAINDAEWLRLMEQATICEDPLIGQIALWMVTSGMDMEAIQIAVGRKLSAVRQDQIHELLRAADVQIRPQVSPTGQGTSQVTESPTSGATDVEPDPTGTTGHSSDSSLSTNLVIGIVIGFALLVVLAGGGVLIIGRKGFPVEWEDLFKIRR